MTIVKMKMMQDAADLKPTKAHPDDAAFDLRARESLVAEPMRVTIVPTGLSLELPVGFEAQIRPRSGLAAKSAIGVLNSPGTIDAGYRGEIKCILFNAGTTPFQISRGDRIAQMVISKLPDVQLVEAEDLSETQRADGGFGSTGVK